MAKYSYPYACGHGTGTVTLYGKTSDRERKLAWYEQNMVCPDCYKAKKSAENEAAEQVATIKYRLGGGAPVFSVIVHGKIQANKDALKGIGFYLDYDEAEGLRGFLATKEPPKAWQKTFEARSEKELLEQVEAIINELAPLGYQFKDTPSNLIDMGMLFQQWQEIAKKETEKQANKPPYNGCFEFLKKRHGDDYAKRERAGGNPWNGKIYGKKGGYNYYIDDTRYSMTDEQRAEIVKYQTAMSEWREKYK